MTQSNSTDSPRIIVSKFGGSSMADAEAMRRSAAIAIKQESSVVVVSATYGTTNLLVEIIEKATGGVREEVKAIIIKIKENHRRIARDLSSSEATLSNLESLLNELSELAEKLCAIQSKDPRLTDHILGMGEQMSSLLFAECVSKSGKPALCFDAGKILKTDHQHSKAVPDFEQTGRLCLEVLKPILMQQPQKVVVTQGFIGTTATGERTTLGRGGSDYSAAIFAWALDADVLEIWTDVGGIASTDPRIVPEARPISTISFQEAAEMATFGAKILHPSTLIPAMWKETPVFVGSSIDPSEGGTWIYRHVENAPLVRALAIRRNQTLMTITTPEMLNTFGFLYRVFRVFNEHRVSVDSITTSEISVAMTVDDVTVKNRALVSDLEKLGQLTIESNYELVSLIGNNINHTAGLAQVIFQELKDINVRMICQGASRHNCCFLVDETKGEEAIRRLHAAFIVS